MSPDTPKPSPLLTEFPPTELDAWRARVEQELGQSGYADLTWQTDDGFALEPVPAAEGAKSYPHRESDLSSRLRPGGKWRIRQQVATADPAVAHRICHEGLRRGADELLLTFDQLAWHGVDPGTLSDTDEDLDVFEFETGQSGCAIYHAKALDEVLASVDLAQTHLAIDAGASTLAAFGMLLHIAHCRGVPRDQLSLSLGLDPVHELVRGATFGESTIALLAECVRLTRSTVEWPNIVPIAVHGSGFHRAGASTSQELGCVIATAIEYVRQMIEAGVEVADATASLCFRLQVGTDMYLEIAKLRAVRLLWAKVARAFGAEDLTVEVHVESSLRSWSNDDPHTNLLRSCVQGMIATLAGCDSIALAGFASHHDERDAFAQSLARNQQLLLREESLMHRVEDPCGGAQAIEDLTDRVARSAWQLVRSIEERGGILAALQEGFVQEQIQPITQRRSEEFRTRTRTLVGISRYVDPRFCDESGSAVDPDEIQHRHFQYLATREESGTAPTEVFRDDLERLEAAAAAGSTIGEITVGLRTAAVLQLATPFFEFSPDGAPFEALRKLVRAASCRVQPILVGDARVRQSRLAFARDALFAGGFEVLEPLDADGDDWRSEPGTPLLICSDDASLERVLADVAGHDKPILVVAKPREGSDTQSHATLYRGCNVYEVLRSLYLDVSESDGGAS